ncbi:amino acid adenylation domain-containing protein [Peribacillus butanolivorans]|uniref:amino acid adenylation domain-containing protein n=1 Tax=Peribacillus butanolivorans TaxID=421767 RepID=UPI00367133C8
MNRKISGTEEKLVNMISNVIDPLKITLLENINELLITNEKHDEFLSSIKREFGIQLTPEIISSQSNIEKLASFIDMLLSMREDEENKPFKRGESEGLLSHNQDRMYLFDRLEEKKMLYNMPFKFILNGVVDIDALQQALDIMIQRHETLRTNFKGEEHQILQFVMKDCRSVIAYEDYRKVDPEVINLRVASHLNEEMKRCFNLENDPLFNMKLFRIEEKKYYLVCNFHHIIFDGVSFLTFFEELMGIYELIQTGRIEDIPPIEMQYLDYAAWHKEWVKESTPSQRKFWGRYLNQEEEVLELPFDYQRPKSPSYSGDRLEMDITDELRLLIDTILKKNGITLYTFMMTAYQVFLSQYTGKNQIIVGSTVANRGQEEFARTVGCFVNTLPFKLTVDDTESFHTILTRNRKLILDVLEHQAFPFEKIVEIINPDRDLSYSPLFQTALAMEESFDGNFSNSFFTLEKDKFDIPFSNYDLTIKVKGSQKLVLEFEYSDELFHRETIERLMKSFEKWLFQICQNTNIPIRHLDYLDDNQMNQLLSEWQGEVSDTYQNETIISIFERIVENHSNKLAVTDNGESITYLELDERSNVIANLVRNHMKNGSNKVGLHVYRSIDMVISMLGIIKAGCAYVPLDPILPTERLEYIINDSKIDICITNQEEEPEIKKIANVINLESVNYIDTESFSKLLAPSDLAYIIYTSGTTGKPKGVMLSHRGVVNLVISQNKYLQLNETSKVLQFATFNFDASIYEIFGSLLNGAELHIGNNKEEMFDLFALENQIISEKLTHLVLPPAVLQELNIEDSDVTFVGSAGSECPIDLLNRYQKINFYNAYGPTEYSVWTTFEMFKAFENNRIQNNKVSIGKPILNTNIYLLSPEQKLVPIGAIGEIYIGGEGLAVGYVNNDDLTIEKFIEHPFKVGKCLYRSGDLAKFTSNGELIFLGRKDNQVKIRGFRVEVDEISITLNTYPQVIDSFIKIQDQPNLNKQIIAYFTSKQQVDSNQLKAFLKERLPNYMIPSFFIQVDKFPLNANGKIDSAILPVPDTRSSTDLEVPKTNNEKVLLQIFKSVLGIDVLSIRDNFFELGGDSIQSIQICSLARQEGIIISPKSIFENQTVAELAAIAKTENKVMVQPIDTRGNVELTPIQEWFFAEHTTSINHWNQSIVFSKNICAQIEDIEKILSQIVEHHDGLLTLFENHNNKYLGNIDSDHKTWELVYKDIHHLDEETRIRTRDELEMTIQGSLDIRNGPIMKMLVLKEQSNKYRFLWVIHHLLVDAVSWRILLEDFNYLHDQVLNNQTGKLATKTSSFKDWSNFLKKYNETLMDSKTIRYWEQKIKNKIADFKIIKDFIAKEERTIEKSFSEEETEFLIHELTSQSKATIEEVLLSLIAKSVNQSFEVENFWIEVEGHGREIVDETIDVTRTVGWFTAMYPILLHSDATFNNTLKNTKNAIREIPNKGFDYGVIKYLRPGVIQEPDIHVTFNYLGKLDSQFESSNSKDFGEFENKPKLHFLALVQDGKLTIKIISKLAKNKIDLLIEAIDKVVMEIVGTESNQSSLIESDFPDAMITEEDLFHILNSNK